MTDKALKHGEAYLGGWAALFRNWPWLLGLGVLWICLGTLAIVMPFAATLAFELVLGAIFAAGGIAQLVQAFGCRGWRGFAVHAVAGLLALVLGGLLLFFPMQGIVTLTLFLSAFFLASGVLKIISAIQHRSFGSWGWMLLSGILGLAIGLLILFGLPGTAAWVLGLLVGIELIFSGWSMVMLAISARRSEQA